MELLQHLVQQFCSFFIFIIIIIILNIYCYLIRVDRVNKDFACLLSSLNTQNSQALITIKRHTR
jgi:hypothetical protein